MEEAFTAYLLGSVTLTGIIGTRLTWSTRPQVDNTPACDMINVSSIPEYSDDGEDGLAFARIQIDSWAKTYALAKNASRAVTARLSNGGTAKFVSGGFEFQGVFKEDEQDSFERGAAAEDLYRTRLDFTLLYKEIGA